MIFKIFAARELPHLFELLAVNRVVGRLKREVYGDHPVDSQEVEARAGIGGGAVEVPRGILYHCLGFDGDRRIQKADCVIPTSQNHANIYHDIEELALCCVRQGKRDKEIELRAEMLVMVYDPCIPCSVH